jgi:glutamate racemase
VKHSHLGFVDWGIGGLTVLAEVLKQQPNLQITYFSDAGFTPYGKLSANELNQRLQEVFKWLEAKGCDGVVVACNAASAAILQMRSLENTNTSPLPIYDVITPTLRFLQQSTLQRLGVIGGDATVQSHIYRDSLLKLDVTEQSAQPLSALIEEGKLSENDIVPLLKIVFKSFEPKEIQALVLACTHYPAVAAHIYRLHPQWALVDPAVIVGKELLPKLIPAPSPSKMYYSTGSAQQTITSAKKAFGFVIYEVEQLPLSLHSSCSQF